MAVELTNEEIARRGFDALVRELGVTGAVRFIRQNMPGSGDYVKVSRRLFDRMPLEEMYQRVMDETKDSAR